MILPTNCLDGAPFPSTAPNQTASRPGNESLLFIRVSQQVSIRSPLNSFPFNKIHTLALLRERPLLSIQQLMDSCALFKTPIHFAIKHIRTLEHKSGGIFRARQSKMPSSDEIKRSLRQTHPYEGTFGARVVLLRSQRRRLQRTLALPLVIFAQQGLVLFGLGFQLAERFLAGRQEVFPFAGRMQRSGGQR